MTVCSKEAIVLGLGCSTSADAAEIVGLIRACLAEAGADASQIVAIATHLRKRDSLALQSAAHRFDLPLRYLDDEDLAPGVPGTSEAVAAAAGPVLLGKRKSRFATCAIALAEAGFDPAHFGQPASPSATIAPSTLAASVAGR